jgi:hypothetical protein
VIRWRQKASDVVLPEDKPWRPAAATMRHDLEQGCKQLKGFLR